MTENLDMFDRYDRILRPILGNTAKDGTGTPYFIVVDANGNIKVAASAKTVVETTFSATASMVVGTHKLDPGVAYKVIAIEIHNSAAPSTGTQNLVLTLDNGTGSAYDVTLLTLDLVANAVTDLRVLPEELLCKSTDVITASFINSDVVTWGLTFKHEVTG